jgi:hypothetical protein
MQFISDVRHFYGFLFPPPPLKVTNNTADVSDKAYQLLAHDRWFSPGTPVSSTTKTGRHDIAEILLKVALNTIPQIKSNAKDAKM